MSCGGCTHTWSPAPLAGQNTANATYQFNIPNGFGTFTGSAIYSNSYNPNVPCSYGDIWQVGVAAQPSLPLPALVNGPWDGDTSKVWLYTRSYLNPYNYTFGRVDFYPSWTVTGGVKLRSVNHRGNLYYNDSVFVKWTGPANMHLNEAQVTYNLFQNMISDQTCNWTPPASSPGYPSLTVFNHPVCQGSPATFFTFPFANSTYTWSVTNGTIVSGQGTNSVQISLNGTGTVSVVRDSSGTLTNASSTVTPMNVVVNLGPDQSLCQGSSMVLTANPGLTNYQWSTGATTQSISVSSPGQYSVTASINGNCVTTDTINISLIPTTRPNLGPDLQTCNQPVTLDAGLGYTAYAWSNGATTQTISALSTGGYIVTVTDGNGCLTSDTVMVANVQSNVSLPPTASYCASAPYTLNPATSYVTTYLWSTGATTPTIQVSGVGTQTIWVQGSNSNGCVDSDTIVVTGNPVPAPNIGPDQTICPGSSVTLDAGPGFTSYFWSNGPNSQTYTVSNPGTYVVTVYNSFSCYASDDMVLSNHPLAPVNLGPDINVCLANATLNAGGGYSSYLWSNGATTPSITVTSSGTYSVTVSGAGGCIDSDTINVNFNNFSFTLGANVTVCEPQTITLDPQLTGNFNYNWSIGATSPTLTLAVPGTYNITLTASNTFGCTASNSVVATVLATPPSLVSGDTILCADTSITLNAGPGFATYDWSTGATTQSIVATSGGIYYLTATAPNGCVRLDTIMISDLIDCVFPGDVNYDGAADVMDVLTLGTAIGLTGPARANATTQWYGQRASNWGGTIVSGVNYKQADTDGNGTLQQADTLAIQLNYGSTHTRTGTVTGGTDQIRIVPLNDPVPAGDVALFGVFYESLTGGDVDTVHGLSMNINWPSLGIANPGLKYIDYSSAWFAPAGNRMTFNRFGANSVELALTRTSASDTSGHGLAMVLGFLTDSTLVGGNVPFAPTVNFAQSVGTSLIPNVLQSSVTAINIVGAVAVQPSLVASVKVWPVPADDVIRVAVEGQMPTGVRLVNMLGQTVIDLPADGNNEFTLPVSHLPVGGYSLQVTTQNGLVVKNVVVAR